MNNVSMTGRLTADPKIYEKVVSFRIAVERRFKREGEPTADFFNCKAFGNTKEFVEKWMTKGMKVEVTGRLQNEEVKSVIDGTSSYRDVIIVNEVGFAESKKKSEESAPSNAGFVDAVAESNELPFK